MVQEQCIMQQTINFAPTQAHARVTLKERVTGMGRTINTWLDNKSGFYSRVAGFAVTRRAAIRVNLVTLAVIVGAAAVEQAPLASLAAASAAAWLSRRLNKDDKRKGGAL